MIALDIEIEEWAKPEYVAHVKSQDGVLGHIQELKERVTVGTWLLVDSDRDPLASYILKHGGWSYRGILKHGDSWDHLLRRED